MNSLLCTCGTKRKPQPKLEFYIQLDFNCVKLHQFTVFSRSKTGSPNSFFPCCVPGVDVKEEEGKLTERRDEGWR